MNKPRHFSNSVKMPNGQIYVIGGEENSTEHHDTAEMLTKNGSKLIRLNKKLSRHCVVPVNDTTLLIIGGINDKESFSRKSFLYNTSSNKFSTGPPLMKGRQLQSCSKLNTNIFVIAGGRDSWGGINTVEILDNINGQWYAGPTLPRKICCASMVEHPDGGVVLIGGQSHQTILNTLYYLPSVDTEWVIMKQKLKTPRRFHSALMVPDSITHCSPGIEFIFA